MEIKLPKILTAKDIAAALHEYNRWRMGEGEYATAGAEPPLSPSDLTRVIIEAETHLEAEDAYFEDEVKKLKRGTTI